MIFSLLLGCSCCSFSLFQDVVEQGECLTDIFKRSFQFGWTEGCLDIDTHSDEGEIDVKYFTIFRTDDCNGTPIVEAADTIFDLGVCEPKWADFQKMECDDSKRTIFDWD